MTVADLKKYKDSLYSSLCRDLSEFEKNFLFISTGLLAFTITFIKDIIDIEISKSLWLLFTSWVFIIIAIALMMTTLLRSVNGSDRLWFKVDEFILANEMHLDTIELTKEQFIAIKAETNKIFTESKKTLKGFRYSAVTTFLCGVVCLSVFVSLNLFQERKSLNEPSLLKKGGGFSLSVSDSAVRFISDSSMKLKRQQFNLEKTDTSIILKIAP